MLKIKDISQYEHLLGIFDFSERKRILGIHEKFNFKRHIFRQKNNLFIGFDVYYTHFKYSHFCFSLE